MLCSTTPLVAACKLSRRGASCARRSTRRSAPPSPSWLGTAPWRCRPFFGFSLEAALDVEPAAASQICTAPGAPSCSQTALDSRARLRHPLPGAVRLARGDQRTSGLIPGTGDKCCTPPNAPLALGAVPFFRFRRRVGSSGLGWIPDGIGAGIPDPIASRRPFRARRLSSACKPRDRASGRRGVFFCVQLGALGGAPLFPNVPPANPVARRSTDTKRRARRPLSRHCSSNYRRRSGLRPLSLARRPSARPMESAAPGDPVPNNPASTSSCCGEHQALARCPFYRIHEWRRARHPAYSTGHDPPSTRLARRLPLVLSARGEGRRGTSR